MRIHFAATTCVALLLLAQPSRAQAADVELDVVTFYGASVGRSGRVLDDAGDGCTISASSLGAATRLSVASPRRGFRLRLDGAAERDSLLSTRGACDANSDETAMMAGGSVRVGYAWPRFALEVGVGVQDGLDERMAALPRLQFVVQSAEVAIAWGLGSELAAHAASPGAFLNLSTNRHRPVRIELETGIYIGGPAMERAFTSNAELVLGFQVSRRVQLRPGFALTAPTTLGIPGHRTSLGLRWDLDP